MAHLKRRIGLAVGATAVAFGMTFVAVAPANAYGIFHGQLQCSSSQTTHISSTIRYNVRHEFSTDSSGDFYVEYDYSNGSVYKKRSTGNGQRYNDWLTIGYDTGPYQQFNFYCG